MMHLPEFLLPPLAAAGQNLFVSAFVYLVAAVLAVFIAKRVGLSSVLGYLVAGMVIGPFGLKLIGEEGQDVMHFAEFGVVMMLFLIGLELKPALLWRLRNPILGLGGAQVVITAGLIFGIVMIVGLPWQMALAIGLALALSSTAIVLQGLQEKGLSNTVGGRSAFSVLLFQDIAVIPMLAVYPLLVTLSPAGADGDAHGGSATGFQAWLAHQPGWVNTLLVLGAVVAIILAGRYLVQPALRMIAATHVREAFVALALVLVIGIALLMGALGVSAALGTFLAGVVLADSEYRHELEADIEPFKGLLLGVFFIAVGASIDFSLIAAQPGVVAAVVVGLMVLKAMVLFGLGTIWKLNLDQRFLFGLSLAQGSEFAFVLFGFGVTAGVLPNEVAQVLIAGVALTMAITPLVMVVEEKVIRPQFGPREQSDREADSMDEEAPVILAGIGRFGNFIARLLRSQKIGVTVIDHDSDHIDYLRKLGIHAYYGDANRHDLLESAGAAKAKVIIIALDEQERVTQLIETVRKHFPHLKILVRALSRPHQFELINDGIEDAVHQYSGSAIEMSQIALTHLGVRAHRAHRVARAFARRDHQVAREIAAVHKDEKAFVSKVRRSLSEMEDHFDSEHAKLDRAVDEAWDTTDLRQKGVRS